jgi:hypothetical protein
MRCSLASVSLCGGGDLTLMFQGELGVSLTARGQQ